MGKQSMGYVGDPGLQTLDARNQSYGCDCHGMDLRMHCDRFTGSQCLPVVSDYRVLVKTTAYVSTLYICVRGYQQCEGVSAKMLFNVVKCVTPQHVLIYLVPSLKTCRH
eukprot:1156307-Pelagomonas_calceolata.AAC.5